MKGLKPKTKDEVLNDLDLDCANSMEFIEADDGEGIIYFRAFPPDRYTMVFKGNTGEIGTALYAEMKKEESIRELILITAMCYINENGLLNWALSWIIPDVPKWIRKIINIFQKTNELDKDKAGLPANI